MTSIAHKQSDSTVLSSYTYGYDDAGQRTYVKRANGKGDVYEYDATDQLTNVLYEATNPDTSPSSWTNQVGYVFDAAGNRTSLNVTNTGTTSYAANELNQYTNVGGALPTYDANGNLTYDGSVWTYTYDRENRLIEADDLSVTIHYTYDAFNRLIWRTQGASETRFYYDDQWRVIAEYDENDSLVAKYVYGPEIDEPLQMARNGTNYYYHAAALGTVTEITLADETIVERYTYDVYGTPNMWDGGGNLLSGSAIGNRLMFQGRDRDPDTGLYNFRNRYYSPSLGRFVQVDPIGQRGGLNLYAFVRNNTITRKDPFGLQLWYCTTPTTLFGGIGRHGYIWNDDPAAAGDYSKQYCGQEGCSSTRPSGAGTPNYGPTRDSGTGTYSDDGWIGKNPEDGRDIECVPIDGTDDDAANAAFMQACNSKIDKNPWIGPGIWDCHTSARKCLRQRGYKLPDFRRWNSQPPIVWPAVPPRSQPPIYRAN